ncbi:hypothetical protein GGR50DRAFT_7625 [Xylaria sp. CBS 124048]|nr:hypothetical protein GGR50DRAFT_7625 [Xylaria sp. CBS 124048]
MKIPQDLVDEVMAAAPAFLTSTQTAESPMSTMAQTLPKIHNEYSTENGHRALWVVCVVMGVTSLAFYLMAMRVPVQKRLFHIITALITTFAFLSYYAMATGSGIGIHTTAIRENKHGVVTDIVNRQVFWSRYVDWSLTTPLLLLDLALLAGMNGATVLILMVSDVIMVLSGLFASYSHDQAQGWGWYAFACIAFLNIVYQLGYKGRQVLARKDTETRKFVTAISIFTLVIWTLYPIMWGVSEGARKMSVDGEIIAYAVLDILAKPVFGFWLLLTHDSMGDTSPSVEGFWSHGLSSDGLIRIGEHVDD